MAVSNTIGSNTFDILLCLGIPWLVKTSPWNHHSPVVIHSHGLYFSCFFILGSVVIAFLVLFFSKWVLTRKVGYIFYVELHSVHLTTCTIKGWIYQFLYFCCEYWSFHFHSSSNSVWEGWNNWWLVWLRSHQILRFLFCFFVVNKELSQWWHRLQRGRHEFGYLMRRDNDFFMSYTPRTRVFHFDTFFEVLHETTSEMTFIFYSFHCQLNQTVNAHFIFWMT